MTSNRPDQARPQACPGLGPLLWILAAALGIVVAVAVAITDAVSGIGWRAQTLVAIAAGGLTVLTFAPWLLVRRERRRERALTRITLVLRSVAAHERQQRLGRLLSDHEDDLAELGRLIHAAISKGRSDQARVTLLERSMDSTIEAETSRATGHLRREVMTDALTGLGNRRALNAALNQLTRQTNGVASTPISILAIDVDEFKQINDALGHDVGDKCLVFLAQLLRSALRTSDQVIRLGGDEFIVILPRLDGDQAAQAAQRIASLFQQMPWEHEHPAPTLSIGVAALEAGVDGAPDELLKRADEAMYAAKRAGRGCVHTESSKREAA